MKNQDRAARRAAIVELARKEHESEGTLEIDDAPKISELAGNNGAYVAAWVWVDFAGTALCKSTLGDCVFLDCPVHDAPMSERVGGPA